MIKIVTDSTAYLPEEVIQRYNISVIPLNVLFGERSYKEGLELSHEQFYKMLAQAKDLPTTSQPSVGEFQALYSELVKDGSEVISIHISSKLSGTVDSALMACKEFPGAKISVVDSLSTAIGLELMVVAAAEAVAAGQSRAEVVAMLERMVREIRLFFVVDTLEYLQKGGRIGGAAALVGTLLNVKPILCLKEGRVEPLDKVRTKRKAVARILDAMVEEFGSEEPVRVAVGHAMALEEGEMLLEKARSSLNCSTLSIAQIGPAIGTHTGPGALGLAACPERVIHGQ
ncbi:MAG: DegV family protein [Anaerolineae bacterium]|jgi:DegV family protein with EDD domain|nr:DegV family protein [Anaerolineae bacterium]